ncbi:hypothetical protein LTR08_005253 [Meristemomyces frigidus]|nr:hypothetical protein LTR08_005253 [Meristemomyces frigidus]
MTQTHLPAHMDSVRTKLRRKHEVLVLKCYPRLPKNSSADVQPNPSELAYLTFYACTRTTKLPKVGSFLERRTATDLHNAQSARVSITLQILTALLSIRSVEWESGFPLIAPYVLRIIICILDTTTDISLIEASHATWEAFCDHSDQPLLASERSYMDLYEQALGRYAHFARIQDPVKMKLGNATQPVAAHELVRLRDTGLRAIHSVLVSGALAFDSAQGLIPLTIPAILSNLHSEDGAYVEYLLGVRQRARERDEKIRECLQQGRQRDQDEAEKLRDRDNQIRKFLAGENITLPEPAPIPPTYEVARAAIALRSARVARAAEGTALLADQQAEERVGLFALDCLRAAFNTENRGQVRGATSAVLKHLNEWHQQYQIRSPQSLERSSAPSVDDFDSWANSIFKECMVCTPVQGRFILLVTAVDTLVRLPLKETDLRQHLLYASLIGGVLRSDVNLIGLSVMDVLLGLVAQILRVLHLANRPFSTSSQVPSDGEELKETLPTKSGYTSEEGHLGDELGSCIIGLVTHIYYTDQVSDMLSAILLRLKPSPAPVARQDPAATAAATEKPKSAASSSNTARDRSTGVSDGYFSFDHARLVALRLVYAIIERANRTPSHSSGEVVKSRNPVPITTWEGTQWLLNDPNLKVRKAYTDALIIWLERETTKTDFQVPQPMASAKQMRPEGSKLARRAVSNAATGNHPQDRQTMKSKQTFLQLLHLANYENALQFAATSPDDLIALNELLFFLVKRLGINAVASGLPMIFALQEDIARVESPIGKVRIGTLVHGYLWAVVEIFDFEHEITGKAILAEVARRKEKSIWVREMQVPPLSEPSSSPSTSISSEIIGHEELRPFDGRESLVDSILDRYQHSVVSPGPSAPGSPGRTTSPSPIDRSSSYLGAKQVPPNRHTRDAVTSENAQLKREMMRNWTREECMAAIVAMAPKTASLSGSRSSPNFAATTATAAVANGNHRQLLAAVNAGGQKSTSGMGTPPRAKQSSPQKEQAYGGLDSPRQRLDSQSPDRRPSGSSAGKSSSSAPAKGPPRVDALRHALSNGVFIALASGPRVKYCIEQDKGDDTASESMVDVGDADLGSDDASYAAPPRGRSSGKGKERADLESDNTSYATAPLDQRSRERTGRPRKGFGALLDGISIEKSSVMRVSMGKPPYY